MFQRIFGSIFVTVFLVWAPLSANAGPFEFKGTCVFGCANFGLTGGESVSGEISFSDAAVIPNAAVDTSDVVSFSFPFGTFAIDDVDALSFSFEGTLDGMALSFTSFAFTASEAVTTPNDDTLAFFLNDSRFANQGRFGPGRCVGGTCSKSAVSFASGGPVLVLYLTFR
jgi:hypothetical protein